MILQSVEIAGFKSFARRTKIEFGADFCAIVGPNGSGKSNVADALRWVLGEQKNRLLRTQKSEEVIFHGAEGKPRASMAEVTLTLNNEKGSIPVDFSTVEITRRLYRSGESNYLLNGKKVTAGYLQELLAKSKFGVGSYTVIGQGMIDRLILGSGKERKLLFEEASGIKQYEIKLSQTMSKLQTAKNNLVEIDQLLSLLSPDHQQLSNQLQTLERCDQLRRDLAEARAQYLATTKAQILTSQQQLKLSLDASEKHIANLSADLHALETGQRQANSLEAARARESAAARKKLEKAETARDTLVQEISEHNAQLQALETSLHRPGSDNMVGLSKQLQNSQKHFKTLRAQANILEKKIAGYEAKLAKLDEKIKQKTEQLNDVRKKLGSSQKKEYLNHSLGLLDLLQKTLAQPGKQAEAKVIFYKLHRMIRHALDSNAGELALEVGRVQNSITHLLADREEIVEGQTTEIIRLRSLEMDLASLEQTITKIRSSQAQLKASSLAQADQKTIAQLKTQLKLKTTARSQLDSTINSLRTELVGQNQLESSAEQQKYMHARQDLWTQKAQVEAKRDQFKTEQHELMQKEREAAQLQSQWFGTQKPKASMGGKASLADIQKLEVEISLLGQVDPSIKKELEQVTDRMKFLQQQKQDLSKALTNLASVTQQTEKQMEKTFTQSFERINKQFQKYFKDLFGGGSGQLSLLPDADGYGVEIIVSLPNKKSQNLASLSGGEKALASVALLCGILAANPSPFVLLDEVDAALDERNTTKFAEILQSIASHSQILVISHNHDTMAAADELVGVTTTPQGDSQILRVELSQVPESSKKI